LPAVLAAEESWVRGRVQKEQHSAEIACMLELRPSPNVRLAGMVADFAWRHPMQQYTVNLGSPIDRDLSRTVNRERSKDG
jgi:hypothetical protein